MGFIRGFGRFWYDFLIGDDWKIAASLVLTLTVHAVLVWSGNFSDAFLTVDRVSKRSEGTPSLTAKAICIGQRVQNVR